MQDTHRPLAHRLLKFAWKRLPALAVVAMIGLILVMTGAVRQKAERVALEQATAAKAAAPRVGVVTLTLEPRTVRDRITLPAEIEAWESLDVKAEVSGTVQEVLAPEGTHVEAGQTIVRMDSSDYANSLASARAAHDLASKQLERTRNLFKQEIAPRSELDRAEAALDQARAALDMAELNMARTEVRSPIAGVVDRLDARLGRYVAAKDPVARVLQMDRVKAVVGIPESDVEAVRTVLEVALTIEALGGETVFARKHFMARSPGNLARLYRLELEVPNPRGRILPGMFARAAIIKSVAPGSVSVPLYAVVTRGAGKHFVFVVDGDVARRREVSTGILEGWSIQITSGLAPGDRVIVVGQRSVADGQAVDVIENVSDPASLLR